MTDSVEQRLQELTSQTLDYKLDQLDDDVLASLRAARRNAIQASITRPVVAHAHSTHVINFPKWLSPVSTATAFASVALVTASFIFQPGANQIHQASPLDDLALLSSVEEIEFYENLDFYIWLEQSDHAI